MVDYIYDLSFEFGPNTVQRKEDEMKQRSAWQGAFPWRAACVTKYWLVGKIGCAARHCFTPNAVLSHLSFLVLYFTENVGKSLWFFASFDTFLMAICRSSSWWMSISKGSRGDCVTSAWTRNSRMPLGRISVYWRKLRGTNAFSWQVQPVGESSRNRYVSISRILFCDAV